MVAVDKEGHNIIRRTGLSPDGCHRDAVFDVIECTRAEVARRDSERFANSIVDALSSHVAILDETGTIIAVNRAWREFAKANPTVATNVLEGANYLQVCDTAVGPHAEEAAVIAAGIRSVMGDPQQCFALEYPCHSPDEKRWFNVRITRFLGDGPIRIVVAHENITARKLAQGRSGSLSCGTDHSTRSHATPS